jgi:hypothetical protein
MKIYAPQPPRRPRHIRVPAFLPVPLRARHDGWTPERQAAFLVALAAAGSVSSAVRKVGMSRESAYALRKHPGGASFAAVWDAVLGSSGRMRKLTAQDRIEAALSGRIKPVVWRGECIAITRKADNSGFLSLFQRAMKHQGEDAQ